LDTPFQGLLLGKVWTTPADFGSQRWEFGGMGAPNFNGGRPKFWTKFLKLHLYPTFLATKVAYRSSDLEGSAAKE